MPNYVITESVGNNVERVNSYADLEKHHPSSGREAGRDYQTINGELEEVRLNRSVPHVKKDFIIDPPTIPAPVSGTIRNLNDAWNTVQIVDDNGTVLAQSLHMARGSQPADGSRIEYGQTMGRMGDVGSPGSVHAHVEAPAPVFERYINDITSGRIQSNGAAVSSPAVNADPMADGVLKRGESGDAVKALQDALNKAGIRDAQGQSLPLTGNFAEKTETAVRQYQQQKGLEVDGKAGNDTLTALGLKPGQQQTPAQPTTPTQPTTPSPKPPENTAPVPPAATTGGSDFGAQLRSSDLKNTSIYLAIGLAEGTIGRNGAPTSAYFEHTDPGNGKVNKGFGSYQVSQDPRGNSLTPEQADSIQANRLAGQWQRVDSALNEAGFKPGPTRDLIAANALDAWNQAPLTFEDRYGLMNKQQLTQLKQSIDGGTSPQAAVTEWRAQSYRDNNGNLDAPGLGGSMERVREDQGRRVAAITDGLQLRPVQAQSGDPVAPSQPSTPSSSAAVTNAMYREGDNGDGVRKLQEALNKNGAALEVDGKFGLGTKAAVENYQRSQNLDADGIAGPRTLAALGMTQAQNAPAATAAQPSTQAPTTATNTSPTPTGTNTVQIPATGTNATPSTTTSTPQTPANVQPTPIAQPQAETRVQQAQSLQQGDSGPAVRQLQEALVQHGGQCSCGKHGLTTDGNYGDITKRAVEQFQEFRGMPVTGIADSKTLTALGIDPQKIQASTNAQPAQPTAPNVPTLPASAQPAQNDKSLMSNPNHPDNRLYQQALSNLEQLGPSGGFRSRGDLENAAASVTADAKLTKPPLTDITHVSKTTAPNGQTFLVATQGDPTNPASNRSYIDYNQATSQTVAQSTNMAAGSKTPTTQVVAQQTEQPQQEPIRIGAAR